MYRYSRPLIILLPDPFLVPLGSQGEESGWSLWGQLGCASVGNLCTPGSVWLYPWRAALYPGVVGGGVDGGGVGGQGQVVGRCWKGVGVEVKVVVGVGGRSCCTHGDGGDLWRP